MQHFALNLMYKAELVVAKLIAQTAQPAHKRWLVPALQKVSDLPRLMQAAIQRSSITSPSDLFCCVLWRCSQSGDLNVTTCDRTWMRMTKIQSRKSDPQAHTNLTPYNIPFKWYDSALDFKHLYLSFSFPNLAPYSTLVGNAGRQVL